MRTAWCCLDSARSPGIGETRFRSTWVAVAFPIVLIALKVVALLIEDPDDRGDDIGILITVVVLAVSWSAIKLRSTEPSDIAAVAAAAR